MISKEHAIQIFSEHLEKTQDIEVVVLTDATVEKPYGWVFFFESKKYVETGNIRSRLLGAGPTVVLRDGSMHPLSTAYPLETALSKFELEHGLTP